MKTMAALATGTVAKAVAVGVVGWLRTPNAAAAGVVTTKLKATVTAAAGVMILMTTQLQLQPQKRVAHPGVGECPPRIGPQVHSGDQRPVSSRAPRQSRTTL
jgi:hypothetical protein